MRSARFRSRPFSRTDDIRRQLPEIRVPVRAIWGAKDQLAKADVEPCYAALREGHPELVARTIPDAGHWVMYEQPMAYLDALLEMLASDRWRAQSTRVGGRARVAAAGRNHDRRKPGRCKTAQSASSPLCLGNGRGVLFLRLGAARGAKRDDRGADARVCHRRGGRRQPLRLLLLRLRRHADPGRHDAGPVRAAAPDHAVRSGVRRRLRSLCQQRGTLGGRDRTLPYRRLRRVQPGGRHGRGRPLVSA